MIASSNANHAPPRDLNWNCPLEYNVVEKSRYSAMGNDLTEWSKVAISITCQLCSPGNSNWNGPFQYNSSTDIAHSHIKVFFKKRESIPCSAFAI